MDLKHFLFWKGKLKRKPFFFAGVILLALKYNLDRVISLSVFDRNFYFIDYFYQHDIATVTDAGIRNNEYYLFMLALSLPFIWTGTMMCLNRLRDAAFPLWTVVFFFVPFLNLIFFMILSLIPSSLNEEHNGSEKHRSKWLDKVIPESREGSALVAIGAVVVIGALLAAFSIQFLKEYGWHLFVGIPFFIGLGSTLLYGYHRRRSYKACLGVAFISVAFFSALLLALAVEGLLCIIMAAPFGLLLAFTGASLGFVIQDRVNSNTQSVFFSVAMLLPFLAVAEYVEEREAPFIHVTTSIIIDRPPREVWNHLVAFNRMDAPGELLFHSGIAYPIKAEIKGCGKGAVRNCIFTTGAFVEPIEVWDEPRLLKFSVADQPPPMVEWSFYDDLHAPHLEGYFRSEQGQFLLTPQAGGKKTKLEGTTWYRHRIWPGVYWRLWSDYILHKIHLRVLNHIKQTTEQSHAAH